MHSRLANIKMIIVHKEKKRKKRTDFVESMVYQIVYIDKNRESNRARQYTSDSGILLYIVICAHAHIYAQTHQTEIGKCV